MSSILLNIIGIIVVGIAQVSFLTTWPAPVDSLNFALSLLIFLTVIVNYQKGLWWALGTGLFSELYGSSFFGVITLSLLATVITINFLFNNFFTNRSLYSLVILGFIGTISYSLFSLIFKLIILVFGVNAGFSSFNFWLEFFWQPIFNAIILFVIFFTFQLSTGKLKNIFYSPNTP